MEGGVGNQHPVRVRRNTARDHGLVRLCSLRSGYADLQCCSEIMRAVQMHWCTLCSGSVKTSRKGSLLPSTSYFFRSCAQMASTFSTPTCLRGSTSGQHGCLGSVTNEWSLLSPNNVALSKQVYSTAAAHTAYSAAPLFFATRLRVGFNFMAVTKSQLQ